MAILIEQCPCCKSNHIKLRYRLDGKVALTCGECTKWIKWVGAKEIPIYEKMIGNNLEERVKEQKQNNHDNASSSIEIKIFNKDNGRALYKTLTNKEVEKLFNAIDINEYLL